MGLKLITAPTTTPVTLLETKDHLRQDGTDQDALIGTYITAATDYAEKWMGRALVDQTWDLVLDSFPTEHQKEIKIPMPPLIEVVSVNYIDTGGMEQTIDPTDYYVDKISEPGWIVTQGGASWPVTLDAVNAVRIRYRAGFIDNATSPPSGVLPFSIKASLLLIIGSYFQYREQLVVDMTTAELPWGVHDMLRKYRIERGMA